MNQHSSRTGRLFGVGVGPGDPDLVTVKALRIVREAHVIAYLAARHGRSNARSIVHAELTAKHIELALIYPVTTEVTPRAAHYEAILRAFYDESAAKIAEHLALGRDVAVLCEGDPFFYGSFMYFHDRLAHQYPTEIIPGVTSVTAASARLGIPLVRRDAKLTILPGTLGEDALTATLAQGGSYAIMKLGRNFTKVRTALHRAGLSERASYIERATMLDERILPLHEVAAESVPYFSLVIVPAADLETPTIFAAQPNASLCVVGLGPGAPEWISSEARAALQAASDLVGYQPYLDRVPILPGQRRHGSDNRVELERARHALELAQEGRRVCVVSSGDPGIFAMGTAVMEAIEHGPMSWRNLDVRIVPGISAMQAAAARVGAPLGHDFCVISLSDHLKPWETIVKRLEAAARADFALALYNPSSSQRQWQLAQAGAILLRHRTAQTPVVVARDVGGKSERITITDLAHLDPHEVDMRTVLLIGSSTTRSFARADGRRLVYTPRTYARK